MRKISANLVLTGSSPPLPNGIIVLDDQETVLEVRDTGGRLREEPGLEFYSGIILPGFVLPWLNPGEPADLVELDRRLILSGIKGAGVLIRQNTLSVGELELMHRSPISYHLILALYPEPGLEEFETFKRGVDLLSHAWNEFNLSGSLVPGTALDELSELYRYIREYNSVHQHVDIPGDNIAGTFSGQSLNILEIIRASRPGTDLDRVLPAITLDAAERIFESELLGSIEKGKRPGLNLISGVDTRTLRLENETQIRVLV